MFDPEKVSNTACSSAPTPQQEHGVNSAIKEIRAELIEAENLSAAMQDGMGISSPPGGSDLAESNLAQVLRSFASRLAQVNARNRDSLRHLAS